MKYKMTVWLTDPETPDGMNSTHVFKLTADFGKGAGFDYGNGYHVSIHTENRREFNPLLYDLRYDRDFREDEADLWLVRWAKQYWSGKNGAWKLTKYEVEEA